ncbi:MAG: hypothetical protein LBM60_02575, partial [Clostridium sp.]|nr:hypothetical protein [Clostridium sp.]
SDLMKKMFESYPGAAFPDDEKSFVAAAEKLGFAESDIQAALGELSQIIIDDESLDAITGGGYTFPGSPMNVRR